MSGWTCGLMALAIVAVPTPASAEIGKFYVGIEGGGFSISVGEGPAIGVEQGPQEMSTLPPVEIDPEEFQAAAEACQSVYDEYPELEDVFPDGGPAGGVFVGRAESGGGGS